MEIIEIKTQDEFNKLPESFENYTEIRINSDKYIDIVVGREIKNSTVYAYGSSTVYADGSSTVYADGSSTVKADGSSTVYADGSSTVKAYGSSTVYADGSSTVKAYGSSTVKADGSSTVKAYGSSTVKADGSSTVYAYGPSTVYADGSSTVYAYGSSTVKAYGSSCIHAFNISATITLFSFAVCILIQKAKVNKKSKTSTVIKPKAPKNPNQAWLDKEGVEGKDKVILYKRVSKDLKTQENTKNETLWAIGATLIIKNWDITKECGEGKYHACAETFFCDDFRDLKDDRYIAIEVDKKDLFAWPLHPQYPHKIAFKRGVVLYEVDRHGKRIS